MAETASLRPGTGLAILELAASPRALDEAAGRLGAALGCIVPQHPPRAETCPSGTLAWVGPGRWWLFGAEPAGSRLGGRLGGAGMAVLDVSAAYRVFAIDAGSAPEILARGCSVDFSSRAFPPGSALRTRVSAFPAFVHSRPDGRGFELMVPRSYAASFADWLADAEAGLADSPAGRAPTLSA